jgi:hypothetical protein
MRGQKPTFISSNLNKPGLMKAQKENKRKGVKKKRDK